MKKNLTFFLKGKSVIIFIVLTVLFFSMIISLAGFSFYLNTDQAKNFVQSRINRTIAGSVTWENGRFSLFGSAVELTNLSVMGPEKEKIATLKGINIDFSWRSFFKNQLVVKTAFLDQPRLFLQKDGQGKLNIAEAFKPSAIKKDDTSKKGFPLNLIVRELKLREGFFSFCGDPDISKKAGDTLVLRDIELTLKNGNLMERTLFFNLGINGGSIPVPGVNTRVNSVKLKGLLKKDRIDSLVFLFNTDFSSMEMYGSMDNIFSDPVLDIVCRADTSLPELGKIFQIKTELDGMVNVDLSLKGDARNPDVTFQLQNSGFSFDGNRLVGADLNCSIIDRKLDIKDSVFYFSLARLGLKGDVDFTKAFPGGFFSDSRNLDAISYNIFLKQDGTFLEEIFKKDSGIHGEVDSTMVVNGYGIHPETIFAKADLKVGVKKFAINQLINPLKVQIKTKIDLAPGKVAVERMNLCAGKSSIDLSGDYDLFSHEIKTAFKIESEDLPEIFSFPLLADILGKVNLDVSVAGTIKEPMIILGIKGENIQFREVKIGNLFLQGAIDNLGIVDISRLSIENQGSILQGNGIVKLFEDKTEICFDPFLDFALTFQNFEAVDFTDIDLGKGCFSGTMKVEGRPDSLMAAATLQGKALRYREILVGDLDVDIRLKNGTFFLDQVNLLNKSSAFNVSGSLQAFHGASGHLLENPSFDLALTGENIFIKDFFQEFDGEFSLNCKLMGDRAKPEGKIFLKGKNISILGQKIDGVDLASRLEIDKLIFDSFGIIFAGGEKMLINGWASISNYDLQIVSDGISLHGIYGTGEDFPVKGMVSFDFSGEGSFKNPEFNGIAGLIDIEINGKSLEDFQVHGNLKNMDLHLYGESPFEFDARYQLQKKDFSVSALFNKTDLAPYLFFANQELLSSIITGKISLNGNALALKKVKVKGDISRLDLCWDTKTMAKARDFKFFLENKEFALSDFYLSLGKGGGIEVKGGGNLAGILDLEANAHISLAEADLFTHLFAGVTGSLGFNARLGGSVFAPELFAELELADIGMEIPKISQNLHDFHGRIEIIPGEIIFDNIHGMLDTGRFDLSGSLGMEDFKPSQADLKFTARRLPVAVSDYLEMLLDVSLAIRGTPKESFAAGELVIIEGSYTKDVNLNFLTGTKKKKRKKSPLAADVTIPFLQNMILDVALKHKNPFIVDNNLALLTLKPDLGLRGTLNNPLISGRAEVESGIITYRKKEFKITKGVFDFVNPYKTEPLIDLKSQVEIRSWTIYLEIGGTPDNLKLTLASDPLEQDKDILSLLLTGRTTLELIKNKGGRTRATEEILVNILAEVLNKGVKTFSGARALKIEYKEGANEDDFGVKIMMEGDLSRKITLRYGMETTAVSIIQRVFAEYRFLENFSMGTFRDTEGEFGGELQYQLEFR